MPELGQYDETAAPSQSFDPLPTDTYAAMIVESDVVRTKNNDGDRLTLKWQIVEGEYAGRFIFDAVNLRLPSVKATEIGQRQLAAIRLATGVDSPRASEELHNIPCRVKVKVVPAGPDGNGIHREAKNEVKGYEAYGNQQPAAPVQQASAPAASVAAPPQKPVQQPATVPAGAPRKMPWQK